MLRFIRNVWTFRRELWEWRAWDFAYAYRMFARCLSEMAAHHRRDRVVQDWERLAIQCEDAVAAWREFEDEGHERTDRFLADEIDCDTYEAEEQAAWDRFHHQCRKYGRAWWD